jgi:hypothetical protein
MSLPSTPPPYELLTMNVKSDTIPARSLTTLPDRLKAGHLVLVQGIGVRISVREPKNHHFYGGFLYS